MSTTKSDAARERALARARAERRESGAGLPPGRDRPAVSGPVRGPAPVDDGVATLAARYLVDGYEPDEVAERLGVDRAWCRRIARRFSGGGD
ncbi:hypothetical protein ACQEVC_34455 [Plantactinospora sp. CA-294935]|uniref:hypothetical protein n=1 Tax=Plantactinospora sp. CA-294935 TaxID=3240012 RepID=UPI003D903D1F